MLKEKKLLLSFLVINLVELSFQQITLFLRKIQFFGAPARI